MRRTTYSWKPPSDDLFTDSSKATAWPRTRSPILNLVTPFPTSKTSPATSVPRMNGSLTHPTIKSAAAWMTDSYGLNATAAFFMTISFGPGGVYGASDRVIGVRLLTR